MNVCVDWIQLIESSMDLCEHNDEHSGSMKADNFFTRQVTVNLTMMTLEAERYWISVAPELRRIHFLYIKACQKWKSWYILVYILLFLWNMPAYWKGFVVEENNFNKILNETNLVCGCRQNGWMRICIIFLSSQTHLVHI